MSRKAKKHTAHKETLEEFFGWINSTNRGELAKSFEKHLTSHGYIIVPKDTTVIRSERKKP